MHHGALKRSFVVHLGFRTFFQIAQRHPVLPRRPPQDSSVSCAILTFVLTAGVRITAPADTAHVAGSPKKWAIGYLAILLFP